MCAMSPRLLRPVTSGFHPEAQVWRNAVIANGGSVSASTVKAVSDFCKSIDQAGIRDRFYRLNLFCGTGLNAALVPLYRGQSRTGTQYGNATDTNNGPFVAADYNETGSSSGLKGNNSSKWLGTGFNANTIAANSSHLGVGYLQIQSNSGIKDAIGAFNGGSNAFMIRLRNGSAFRSACFTRFTTSSDTFGDDVTSPLQIGNIVASWPTMYRDGSATGTDATTSQDYPSAHQFAVFALFNGGTSAGVDVIDARLGWYSIGATMTSPQVVSFNDALVAFATSLSRT